MYVKVVDMRSAEAPKYLNYVVVVTSCFYRQMINYDDVGSFGECMQ